MSSPVAARSETSLPDATPNAPDANAPPSWVPALASLTRRFHPRGTDRLVRLLHPPGNDRPVRAIIDYDQGLRLNIDTHSFCEWYIYFYGAFRPQISKLLNQILQPGHVAFDCGANIGMHSVIMANRVGRTGRVVSFEPDPHPRERLIANLRLNGFDFADVRAAALSAKSGKATFFLHDDTIGNYANASLHAENVGKTSTAVEVDLYALDDFVAQNPVPRLDAIKLLAQGEEWNVLQGGQKTLATYRPHVFFLYEPSYWHRQGLQLMDAVRFFAEHRYQVYAVEFGPRQLVTGEIDMGQVFHAAPDR